MSLYKPNQQLYETMFIPASSSSVPIDNFPDLCRYCPTPDLMMEAFCSNRLVPIPYQGISKRVVQWPDDIIRTNSANCLDLFLLFHIFFYPSNTEHYMVGCVFIDRYGYPLACHIFTVYEEGKKFWGINYLAQGFGDINGPFDSLKEAIEICCNLLQATWASKRLGGSNINSVIPKSIEQTSVGPNDLKRIDGLINTRTTQEDILSKFDNMERLVMRTHGIPGSIIESKLFKPKTKSKELSFAQFDKEQAKKFIEVMKKKGLSKLHK